MKRAFIALGSNLGNREAYLTSAVDQIAALPDVCLVARSAIYETEPLGLKKQPAFLNAVIEIETGLEAEVLLRHLLAIEAKHGRRRTFKWGPRTLDLDILLYGDQIIRSERLSVPHPRLSERRFVLVPLADLAPNRIVPGLGQTVAELLRTCPDYSRVWQYEPEHVAWTNHHRIC